MSKFKIRLKLQGLELEVDGERSEIPAITHQIQKQIGGLLQAPGAVITTETVPEPPRVEVVGENGDNKKTKKPRRPRTDETADRAIAPIDFKHDPEKFGSPSQEWSTTEKALWLLFVLEQQGGPKELQLVAITRTFNKHFRAAGAINTGNAWRDLRKAKIKPPPIVGEDTNHSPTLWYLTDEGKRRAQKLIADLKASVPQTA